MSRRKNHKNTPKRSASSRPLTTNPSVNQVDLARLEFHRNAVALMPDPQDKRPGIAIRVEARGGRVDQQFCSCSISQSRTCAHLKDLSRLVHAWQQKLGEKEPDEDFKSSIWYRLAGILADESSETPATIRPLAVCHEKKDAILVLGGSGERLLTYISSGLDRSRFLERCTLPPDDTAVPTRSTVIRNLAWLTLTKNEQLLLEQGLRTRRQALEESFWYKFAYHGYRELGTNGCSFHAAIEESSGSFVVACNNTANRRAFAIDIPRRKVKRVLDSFQKMLCNQHGLAIYPIPLDSLFDVKLNDRLDIIIRPLVRIIQKNGEAKFFERADLKRFQYGNLYYIKELGILAEDQYPQPPPKKFHEPLKTVIKRSQVPIFLEEFKNDLQNGSFLVDEKIKQLKIYRDFKQVEIAPEAIDRDWCWLSVTYGSGTQRISLAEILRTRQAKQRFVATAGGWVDCQSPDFEILDTIKDMIPARLLAEKSDRTRLSRLQILRLSAAGEIKLKFSGR